MKKNRLWKIFILLVLSFSIVGCTNRDIKNTKVEAISYLKDNVENSDSILIESISWGIDDDGIIYYIISYDTENDSGEYLGYKNCIVVYSDPQDIRQIRGWAIYLENEDDGFEIAEAKYNIVLADKKLDSGELSSQEIDEILSELNSSK